MNIYRHKIDNIDQLTKSMNKICDFNYLVDKKEIKSNNQLDYLELRFLDSLAVYDRKLGWLIVVEIEHIDEYNLDMSKDYLYPQKYFDEIEKIKHECKYIGPLSEALEKLRNKNIDEHDFLKLPSSFKESSFSIIVSDKKLNQKIVIGAQKDYKVSYWDSLNNSIQEIDLLELVHEKFLQPRRHKLSIEGKHKNPFIVINEIKKRC